MPPRQPTPLLAGVIGITICGATLFVSFLSVALSAALLRVPPFEKPPRPLAYHIRTVTGFPAHHADTRNTAFSCVAVLIGMVVISPSTPPSTFPPSSPVSITIAAALVLIRPHNAILVGVAPFLLGPPLVISFGSGSSTSLFYLSAGLAPVLALVGLLAMGTATIAVLLSTCFLFLRLSRYHCRGCRCGRGASIHRRSGGVVLIIFASVDGSPLRLRRHIHEGRARCGGRASVPSAKGPDGRSVTTGSLASALQCKGKAGPQSIPYRTGGWFSSESRALVSASAQVLMTVPAG